MNGDRRVDELLAPLRDDLDAAKELRPIDRERVVARMMSAGGAARTPGWRSYRFALLAVPAAFALVFGVVRWTRSGTASSDRNLAVLALGGEVTWRALPLAPGQSAAIDAAGDLVTASTGEVRLRAATGVEIDVQGDTHVGLDGLRERGASMQLYAGRVRCRVPRLWPSDAFSVVTRDVHVVVRGTVFSVETTRAGITTVRVDEGEGMVHHRGGDVTLAASESWTNLPAVAPSRAAAPPSVAPAPPRKLRASPPPPPPRGTLNKETRLLRSGLAAERSGDLTAATAAFDRLLTRFPHSPLVPDAREALARVQAQQRAAP